MLAPERVNCEVLLFWMRPVTLVPMTALMVVVPEPEPELVIVPALLRLVVERVTVPVVALLLMVRLLVPVTPPLKVVEMAVPLLPSVSVPVVVEASMIALLYVRPVVPISHDALLEPPALSPNVTEPVPTPLAAAEVQRIVPALMVVPVV